MENKKTEALPELLRSLREEGKSASEGQRTFERYLREKARDKAIPLSGKFDLTPLCNLDCKMCYVHMEKEKLKGSTILSEEEWIRLMDMAIDAGMRIATLSGGECLIHPGFENIYRHLTSRGVRVNVYTNGVLLSRFIPLFSSIVPRDIQISLYGSNDDGYESVTGRRTFEAVMKGIQKAREASLPIRIAITPSHFMGRDTERILQLVRELNLPHKLNTGLFDPNEETGRKGQQIDLDREDYMRLLRMDNEACIPLTKEQRQRLPLPNKLGRETRGLKCSAGWNSFTVLYDGRMVACNMLPMEELYPLKDGFLNCWKKVRAFAENYPAPSECEGCAYQRICPHCAAKHAQGAPIGHANPEICAFGRRVVEEGLAKLPDFS